MKGSSVAIRYATSLLEMALEKENLDQVANDMAYMYQTAEENDELVSLFKSPIVDASKKLEIIKQIFDQFEGLTMEFVELVVKNQREDHLKDISGTFGDLVKAHKGIVPVELVTATKLDDATRKNILAKVEASVSGTLEVSEVIDPEIIGGFVVRMGDRRIDASVSSQFNKLKQTLTH